LLTVVSTPAQGGNFTYDPPLCAAKTYGSGVVVTLTAVPSKGYQFDKWSGDIGNNSAGNATIHVVMDMSRSITGEFSPSPSFWWAWVVVGVAALLMVVFLVVRFMSGRAKKPDNILAK
jgi:hypothetical protein